MPVIKATNSSRLTRDAIVLDLGDLDRQGRAILSQAASEAERILSDARAEAQKLIDAADARGFEEGLERGIAEGTKQGKAAAHEQTLVELRAQLQDITRSWSEALERWNADRAQMLVAAREDVLAFALAMGRKVIYRELQLDATIIQDQLAAALALLVKPTAAVIRIHPDDRPLVEAALPDLLARFPHCEHLTLRDDPATTRGGCIVAVEGGRIDATIETQLQRIVDTLLPVAPEQVEARPPAGEPS
jgi:flagellar assembly protein FliH